MLVESCAGTYRSIVEAIRVHDRYGVQWPTSIQEQFIQSTESRKRPGMLVSSRIALRGVKLGESARNDVQYSLHHLINDAEEPACGIVGLLILR